jgi:type VI secretion system secreted protein Hcp
MAIYAKITGATQGAINGSVTVPRYNSLIAVDTLSFGFARPFDAHSGVAAGGQVGRPLVISKQLDKSTPLLMTASFNNEVLKNVTITYTHDGAPTVSKDLAKIVLTNAIIQVFEQKAGGSNNVVDELTLTYQSLEFTWIADGIVAQNDWASSGS